MSIFSPTQPCTPIPTKTILYRHTPNIYSITHTHNMYSITHTHACTHTQTHACMHTHTHTNTHTDTKTDRHTHTDLPLSRSLPVPPVDFLASAGCCLSVVEPATTHAHVTHTSNNTHTYRMSYILATAITQSCDMSYVLATTLPYIACHT
jgi:hypothetical protein